MDNKTARSRLLALLSGLLLSLTLTNLQGQEVQAWLDLFGYKEFGKSWEYEGNLGINTVFEDQGWWEYYLCNTFSWKVNKWYIPEGSLELHHTIDPNSSDYIEVRPWLAQKFIFTQFMKRIHLEKPYFYMRLDQRFFWYPGEDTSDAKTRMRLRLGGRFLLNNVKMTEKTIYLPFYFEGFFNFNGEAFEHQAAKARGMVGLGYVFNKRWRSELNYYAQLGRNTIENEVTRTDLIFQLQIKYYFGQE